MVIWDGMALFISALVIVTALFTALLAYRSDEWEGLRSAVPLSLLCLATSGQVLLANANDLLLAFLAIELISVPSFLLAAYSRHREKASEGALKFFVVGAFSSAVLAYGVSLIYGLTGATSLSSLALSMTALQSQPLIALIALAAVMVGLGFKLALVPFHVWVPDTFAGAPAPMAAYFSVAPKMAASVLALRLFSAMTGVQELHVLPVLAVLAGVTMTVSNLMGLQQRNVVRLLAYSSIAHMGYVIMAIVANSEAGNNALVFYGWTYLFLTVGAFAVVVTITNKTRSGDLQSFAGLSKRSPLLAALLAFFTLGLAGIPPTAGFFAKFYLFSVVLQSGWTALVIVGAINIVISIAYYFTLLRTMYFDEPAEDAAALPVTKPAAATLVVSAAATLVLGLAPQVLLNVVKDRPFLPSAVLNLPPVPQGATLEAPGAVSLDKTGNEAGTHDLTMQGLPQ
jgi:NADH-quinone oxidoreductase subunit N